MRRTATAILAALALTLALPTGSPARITEVGLLPATTPPTVPSCPANPCLAISRTTGFQVKAGPAHNFLAAPRAGSVVAFTIMLGRPNATQIKFFNANEGGVSEAGIAILRPQPKPNLTYKLIAQSPTVKLQHYFGKTAQFPLESTLAVRKGDIIALTVPSWALALEPAADFSLEAFSFSSADAPPEGLAPLELSPLFGSSAASLPPASLAAELSPVVPVLVDVVEVDVVCTAAFSALLSAGGVM